MYMIQFMFSAIVERWIDKIRQRLQSTWTNFPLAQTHTHTYIYIYIYELLYMLHLLSNCFDQKDLGLYRDDGITAQSLTRKQADKDRKDIIRDFKACGFSITIEIMLLQTDFLDVTFDLPSGKYWPYRKPNNEPLYVNAKSNHPPVVIKHMNITERLSSISCNKDEFNKSKPIYAEALRKSGFDGNMSFIDPATRNNKRKRIRKASYGLIHRLIRTWKLM